MAKENRICFVIGPIGDPGSDVRKRSDQIVEHIIAPAAQECGYGEPLRADKISAPGIITAQIVQHVIDAEMVVADLTDHNANVFYELAIRHAIRKLVVQLIELGQSIPFDVSPVRTIKLDHHDLDSAKAARLELEKQMKAAGKDPSLADNPISSGIDLKVLKESGSSVEALLARLLEEMTDVRTRLTAIERIGGTPSAAALRVMAGTPYAALSSALGAQNVQGEVLSNDQHDLIRRMLDNFLRRTTNKDTEEHRST